MRFESVARTHVGCRRKNNEDAMLARPDLGLWAVADGMGGYDAGDVASALVVERLGRSGDVGKPAARAAKARGAIEEANRQLWMMAAGHDPPRKMGTTIVAIAVERSEFSCLWAGDSRAYLARDGVLRQLTRDHSLVQHLVDSGDLDAGAAAQHPNANIITRAVGASPRLRLDDIGGHISPGDTFLLASDGFTRLIGEEEISQALAAQDLVAAADGLVQTCLAREAPDNLTFIIVRAKAGGRDA